ncbi:MAG: winged helix-turn-helix domain-containing protein [Candidatus Micrarchaeota archaeon]|nr:winged helix-turn-helix domain-containing protein [Candidatus Micrarchaeota archaeon]
MASTKPAPAQKAEVVAPRQNHDIDGEISELCRMMRLMSDRDVDATLAQVLKTMMIYSRQRPVGGSELARISGINRITILHHLGRLRKAGFVEKSGGKYILRVSSAEDMIIEFRKEMERLFSEMDEMAREIDMHLEEMERQMAEFQRRRRL